MTQFENIFYIVAIIYMAVNIIILVGIGIMLLYVIRTFMNARRIIKQKTQFIADLKNNPEEIIAGITSNLTKSLFKSIKSHFAEKK